MLLRECPFEGAFIVVGSRLLYRTINKMGVYSRSEMERLVDALITVNGRLNVFCNIYFNLSYLIGKNKRVGNI